MASGFGIDMDHALEDDGGDPARSPPPSVSAQSGDDDSDDDDDDDSGSARSNLGGDHGEANAPPGFDVDDDINDTYAYGYEYFDQENALEGPLEVPALVRAVHAFEPEGTSELKIDINDVCVALENDERGGAWLRGKNLTNGADGWFPRNHVLRVPEKTVATQLLRGVMLLIRAQEITRDVVKTSREEVVQVESKYSEIVMGLETYSTNLYNEVTELRVYGEKTYKELTNLQAEHASVSAELADLKSNRSMLQAEVDRLRSASEMGTERSTVYSHHESTPFLYLRCEATATADHPKSGDNEGDTTLLHFQEGDTVYVTQKNAEDDGWWFGEMDDGRAGWFDRLAVEAGEMLLHDVDLTDDTPNVMVNRERDREARFKDKLMAEKSKKRRKFGAALPHCCEMTPRFIDDVIVRQGTRQDIDYVVELEEVVLGSTLSREVYENVCDWWPELFLVAEVRRPHRHIIGAMVAIIHVGTSLFSRKLRLARECQVMTLFVSRRHRTRGVATKLLFEMIISRLPLYEADTVFVEVVSPLPFVQRLWHKYGMHQYEYVRRGTRDVWTMRGSYDEVLSIALRPPETVVLFGDFTRHESKKISEDVAFGTVVLPSTSTLVPAEPGSHAHGPGDHVCDSPSCPRNVNRVFGFP